MRERRPRRRSQPARPTRSTARRSNVFEDDLECEPGDFEDYEDWMIHSPIEEAA